MNAADAAANTVTLSSGAKKIQVQTTAQTIFRRYAGDSIKFEDAKPGSFAQIQTGDQFEVRGAKSDDGLSIQAEEVVSGSFRNLSGTLISVNAAAGAVTLKDLSTKRLMTVTVTVNSDLRKLPPETAARFAARERGTGVGTGSPPAAGNGTGGATAQATGTGTPQAASTGATRPGGAPPAGGSQPTGPASSAAGEHSAGRSAGIDLSKLLARLPSTTLADLHTGDAVMIVASQSQPGTDKVTAVTLLSGVEPILAATPSGSQAMTLSPWNVGGSAPEGGGGSGAP